MPMMKDKTDGHVAWKIMEQLEELKTKAMIIKRCAAKNKARSQPASIQQIREYSLLGDSPATATEKLTDEQARLIKVLQTDLDLGYTTTLSKIFDADLKDYPTLPLPLKCLSLQSDMKENDLNSNIIGRVLNNVVSISRSVDHPNYKYI